VVECVRPLVALSELGRTGSLSSMSRWLPLAPVTGIRELAGTPARPGSSDLAPVSSRLRILLAEDDETNRDVVLLLLDRLDRQADVAGNGVEVLAAVRAAQYDVVLMDIQMPEMDGLEATRRIRSEVSDSSQPAIIAMTVTVSPEAQALFLQTGMDQVLPKPVNIKELAAVLGNCTPNHGSR